MSAQTGDVAYGHAMGRVASGFNWADAMDGMFGKGGLMEKASFTSGDASRNQTVFGQVLWQQANTATPLYGLLPKIPADNAPNNINNPRPVSYRAVFNPPSMSSPAEGGDWGTPVTFDTREVEAQPKHSTIRFENTLLQELFAEIQDGVPFESLTQIGEEYFRREYETSGIARAVGANNGGYSADDALVELDRVIASADEEANADDTTGTAYVDGDLDIYDIDRSDTAADGSNEANWADAVVDHNSGADRQLTRDVMNGTIETLEDNGTRRENLVVFTGRDSARVLSELRDAQFRGDAGAAASRTMGDRGQDEGETRWGVEFNTQLSHWDGLPVVVGPNVPSDSLSRVFILDLTTQSDPTTGEEAPKLGIETYIPMFTETAGLGEPTNTLALGSLNNQVGLGITHEVKCFRFNHQAKVRDLSE